MLPRMTQDRDTPQLGYVIAYVADVPAAVAFWEEAFGLRRRFVHESGDYAELDTGATALAFAALGLASGLPGGVVPGSLDRPPAHVEIALVDADVAGLYARAVAAGAVALAPSVEKPWGQTVAYVRDPDGTLVELASPL